MQCLAGSYRLELERLHAGVEGDVGPGGIIEESHCNSGAMVDGSTWSKSRMYGFQSYNSGKTVYVWVMGILCQLAFGWEIV